jgi:hypothetical protein
MLLEIPFLDTYLCSDNVGAVLTNKMRVPPGYEYNGSMRSEKMLSRSVVYLLLVFVKEDENIP